MDSSERRRSRSGTLERRKTISSYDDMMGNRDLPRFENGSSSAGGGGGSRRSTAFGGGGNRESMSIRSDASSRGGGESGL